MNGKEKVNAEMGNILYLFTKGNYLLLDRNCVFFPSKLRGNTEFTGGAKVIILEEEVNFCFILRIPFQLYSISYTIIRRNIPDFI